jgi:hypothetical protein
MTSRPVRLRIERLVLDGVAPRDRAAVVAAFRTELARWLAAGGAAELARRHASGRGSLTGHAADVLSVSAPSPANAASAGRAAAAALGRAIGGTPR